MRPDTVIKLYDGRSNYEDIVDDFVQIKNGSVNGSVLQLSEDVYNIFDNPYQFITLRDVDSEEELPDDLENDGDPMSDYFTTVYYKESDDIISENNNDDGSIQVFLGFKVFDDLQADELEEDWHEWSGTEDLVRGLSKCYEIQRLTCFKAAHNKQDVFKYSILISLILNDDDNYLMAMDYLQKFRVRRMSGYVALYTNWNQGTTTNTSTENGPKDSIESIGHYIEKHL